MLPQLQVVKPPSKPKWNEKVWARGVRSIWLELLGGKCADCGTQENLEFDVIIPVNNGHKHHKMDTASRMRFYLKQAEWDNLAVRCHKCNAKKGVTHDRKYLNSLKSHARKAKKAWREKNKDNQPF